MFGTSRSCSASGPEKTDALMRLMATSVPFHLPWNTVPYVPEPSSFSSSRSALGMVCGEEGGRGRGRMGGWEDGRMGGRRERGKKEGRGCRDSYLWSLDSGFKTGDLVYHLFNVFEYKTQKRPASASPSSPTVS